MSELRKLLGFDDGDIRQQEEEESHLHQQRIQQQQQQVASIISVSSTGSSANSDGSCQPVSHSIPICTKYSAIVTVPCVAHRTFYHEQRKQQQCTTATTASSTTIAPDIDDNNYQIDVTSTGTSNAPSTEINSIATPTYSAALAINRNFAITTATLSTRNDPNNDQNCQTDVTGTGNPDTVTCDKTYSIAIAPYSAYPTVSREQQQPQQQCAFATTTSPTLDHNCQPFRMPNSDISAAPRAENVSIPVFPYAAHPTISYERQPHPRPVTTTLNTSSTRIALITNNHCCPTSNSNVPATRTSNTITAATSTTVSAPYSVQCHFLVAYKQHIQLQRQITTTNSVSSRSQTHDGKRQSAVIPLVRAAHCLTAAGTSAVSAAPYLRFQ